MSINKDNKPLLTDTQTKLFEYFESTPFIDGDSMLEMAIEFTDCKPFSITDLKDVSIDPSGLSEKVYSLKSETNGDSELLDDLILEVIIGIDTSASRIYPLKFNHHQAGSLDTYYIGIKDPKVEIQISRFIISWIDGVKSYMSHCDDELLAMKINGEMKDMTFSL